MNKKIDPSILGRKGKTLEPYECTLDEKVSNKKPLSIEDYHTAMMKSLFGELLL